MRIKGTSHPADATQRLLALGLIAAFTLAAASAGMLAFDKMYRFTLASDILPNFIVENPNSSNIAYSPGNPLPRWEGTDRVNILVMGIDQREYEQGPWRTDTMIVLTIDPVTKSAGMLSIPRDLWVPIWGYDTEARINTAHYIGDAYGYPGGGVRLAAETVQWNLGIPIHHYARINFTAFQRLIDLIGGIDICVDEEINDPTFPDFDTAGYDPLYIPPGCHHFDGEMALKYARTRHTANSDFDRARRQQEVLLAVFDKVTRLSMLPQLAPRALEMWQTLQGAVVTDLTLDEIIALAQLASEVDPNAIRTGVIDERCTQFWTTPDGQQILIPLRDCMRELRDYIFSPGITSTQTDDPATRLAAENAAIAVLNGTATTGLAGRTAEYLRQQGFQIALVDNADQAYTESLIIVYTGKNYTANYIANLLGLPQTSVVHGSNPNAPYDISVILGADYQPPPGVPQPTPVPTPAEPTPAVAPAEPTPSSTPESPPEPAG